VPAEQSGLHTDQCIRDAARYGFCDHTRLGRRAPSTNPRARLSPAVRDVYAWIGLASLFLTVYWLATHVSLLATLGLTALSSLGWLLVFTCGLPRGFDADLSRVLPPDAARRLRTPKQE